MMLTNLERFKKGMEPARQLYARETGILLKNMMPWKEFSDMDVREYIFDFEKVNGASGEELDKIHDELSNHMKEFSKLRGIEKLFQYFCIWL